MFGVRGADHAEQRNILRRAINHPIGVEYLVAAMLRVRLREHHQLHIRRVALHAREIFNEVGDFVFRQRQAQLTIGAGQGRRAAAEYIHGRKRFRLEVRKQVVRVLQCGDDTLGHAVVD